VPSEWIDQATAVRRICAVLGVDRDNARLRLAQSAGAGRIPARGRLSDGQWRPIEQKWWSDADDWIYYGLSEFTEIEFRRADMLAAFPAETEPSAAEPHRTSPAGSKRKFDWDLVVAEVMRRVDLDGRPSNVREFTRKILGWCNSEFAEKNIPPEQTMRARITKWVSRCPLETS
jgi:hypothetical protein